jgi:hypothetical protein
MGTKGDEGDDPMIFSKRLRSDDHVREFHVGRADHGWEVREEEDHQVVRRTLMDDWHRVENAINKFAIESIRLQQAGWIEVPVVSRMSF